MFRALFLEEIGAGITPVLRDISDDSLPEGDVLLTVLYSGLNYKDALAVTGTGKIIRGSYPFVPGIDLVGRVEETVNTRFSPGDLVIGTGWGLGEDHWGGYAQRQRVRSMWLVPLPDNLTPEESMVIGTAGLTAMLAVMTLEAHDVRPEGGEIIVTGASGGVGSFALALLHASGYHVVASSGTSKAHEFLRELGAERIIDRDELGRGPRQPLDSGRWAGAVDAVGGKTLAAILSQTVRHGSVAACGLAGGSELETTVFPFILRGVNLLGIDSNMCPPMQRRRAWARLANELSKDALEMIKADVITLEDIPASSRDLLSGTVTGRLVVRVS